MPTVTEKQHWAAELRDKGYAILSPAQVKSLLVALECAPAEIRPTTYRSAHETLKTAHDTYERAHHGA